MLERAVPSAPWSIKGEKPDLVKTGPGQYSLVVNGRSHRVLVLKEDKENKTVRAPDGAHTYTVQLEDEQAHLMHELGWTGGKRRGEGDQGADARTGVETTGEGGRYREAQRCRKADPGSDEDGERDQEPRRWHR